jgi:hypothetical protein
MSQHATPAITPSAQRGHGIGLVVCAIFAAMWANWARPLLSGMPLSWTWAAVLIVAAVSGALLFAGASMVQQARRRSRATGAADSAARGMRRGFVLVLIGEIAALNIAAYFLIGHQMAQYLAPAVAVVIGLHFLPLAQIFRSPHFFATAIAMTLAGIVAAAAIATGSPATMAAGIAELVCAATLWATGFVSWFRMRGAITGRQGSIVATEPAR